MDAGRSTGLAEVAAAAATSVADTLRKAFRSRPEVDFKRDRHDPVTEHDKAAEIRIREVILAAEPDSRIVGEEAGAAGHGAVEWHVDPIDGTANFAHGIPFFCTSVAAAVGGRLVAGAIYDPMREELFTATVEGAWCNGRPLSSAGAKVETEALLVTGYPSAREVTVNRDRALVRFADLLAEYRTVRRPGSAALNLAYVAAGWADVSIGMYVQSWDVAAGALLVAAAGGRYLGLRRVDTQPGPAHGPGHGPRAGHGLSRGPGAGRAESAVWRAPGAIATVGTLDPYGTKALSLFLDEYEVVGEVRRYG